MHGENNNETPTTNTEATPPVAPINGHCPEYEDRQTGIDSPPAYSTQAHSPHTYKLRNKAKEPWLVLRIQNKSGTTVKLPRILEGEPIDGSVEVVLKEPDTIKTIVVMVMGELIADDSCPCMFVKLSKELWSVSSTVEPRPSSKGKIQGTHTWRFSITLPRTIELRDFEDDGVIKSWSLPASFASHGMRFSIAYRILVLVKHGIFRPDHTFGVNLNFIPYIQPGPPSLMRRLAYEENVGIPGLDSDPEGWHSLPPYTFRGTLFGVRHVDVRYTLSLAKPLSYTRSSMIPLLIIVDSDDEQALDLFSSPVAPNIQLRRSIHQNYDTSGQGTLSNPLRLADKKAVARIGSSKVINNVGEAAWWTSHSDEEPGRDTGKRTLQGEIRLAPNLFPSTHMGMYKLFYEVAMFDVKVAGFIPAKQSKPDEPLQTVAVEIATIWPDGPRPLSYATAPVPGPST